ncbi:MAG TPA: hypothetical protein P5256_08375 [Beijerinckiaceae bacterium]|nr:hypothetical protein [Rhodoblastus sp.]HRY03128.1 hypothetical protein [Beijerinckiaceae bacterium]
MRTYVNGKETAGLSSRHEAQVRLRGESSPVEAIVLSAEDADLRWARRRPVALILFGAIILLVLGVGIAGVAMSGGGGRDVRIALWVFALACIPAAAILLFNLRLRRRRWREGLVERVALAPPTGAKLVANETGLVVDHCAHPWDAFAVDAIWFIRVTGANDANSFFVERMLVRIDDRTILLDALMLDGGRRLVDAAYASMRERIRAALRVGRN